MGVKMNAYKRKCNWCGKRTNNYIFTPLGVCCDKCHNEIIKRALKDRKENKNE